VTASAFCDYGRAYAADFPLSTFTLLPQSGHLPQVETPEELFGALLDLVRGDADSAHQGGDLV
jgi:pimeloyl-ACP methyl ester carboxylesterase